MYRYMHTVRLYNNPDDAEVRPASRILRRAEAQESFDYASWHDRLRPANLSRETPQATAELVEFVSPNEEARTDRRAA